MTGEPGAGDGAGARSRIERALARIPALAWLTAAAALCSGASAIARLGFYEDDWAVLMRMRLGSPGFGGAVRALAAEWKLFYRPLELVIFPALYSAFGLHPLGWHAASLAASAWAAWALFRLARRLGAGETAALVGALIFLAYPSKDSTLFWPAVVVVSLSVASLAEALIAHCDYVREARPARLAASLAWFLFSVLCYDLPFSMFPAWLLVAPWPGRRPSARATRGFFGAAAAAAATLLYKLVLLRAVLGLADPHPLYLRAGRVLEVAAQAFAANFGTALGATTLSGIHAALSATPLWALLALAFPWIAARERPTTPHPLPPNLFALAVAFLALPYAMLVPSTYYIDGVNHFNRFNALAAFGIGLGSAGALAALRPAWTRAAAGVAGILLAAHIGFALCWAQAYEVQVAALDTIGRQLDRWPAGNLLLVRPREYFVAQKAPVFISSYGINCAWILRGGDRTRRLDIVDLDTLAQAQTAWVHGSPVPYAHLTLLDPATGLLQPADYPSLRALLLR